MNHTGGLILLTCLPPLIIPKYILIPVPVYQGLGKGEQPIIYDIRKPLGLGDGRDIDRIRTPLPKTWWDLIFIHFSSILYHILRYYSRLLYLRYLLSWVLAYSLSPLYWEGGYRIEYWKVPLAVYIPYQGPYSIRPQETPPPTYPGSTRSLNSLHFIIFWL